MHKHICYVSAITDNQTALAVVVPVFSSPWPGKNEPDIYDYSIIYSTNGWYRTIIIIITQTLKWSNHHFDEIFITGCARSCQNDNFWCSQWWKFHQNDHISVSMRVFKQGFVEPTLLPPNCPCLTGPESIVTHWRTDSQEVAWDSQASVTLSQSPCRDLTAGISCR